MNKDFCFFKYISFTMYVYGGVEFLLSLSFFRV